MPPMGGRLYVVDYALISGRITETLAALRIGKLTTAYYYHELACSSTESWMPG
jgi:hypothetical protein